MRSPTAELGRVGRRLAAVAAVAAGMALSAAPAAAQFSPGPLAAPHAKWDRNTACLECHEPRRATTPQRCLACHDALRARIAARQGYHGREPSRSKDCGTCHVDHGGREAPLVVWPGGRDAFQHAETGYRLDGKHREVRCRGCHVESMIRARDVLASRSLRPAATYLGLSTRCAECHRDAHEGQFAEVIAREDCTACHNVLGWNSVTIDHEGTNYPLRGRHAMVACEGCHHRTSEGSTVVRYRPLPHAACLDCHSDPHQKRFGSDCAKCHNLNGWRSVAMGSFDHERTRYPLRGRHAAVACERCHTTGDFKKKIAFARCVDCHADRHEGQLAKSAGAGACDACHSLEGFAPARYGLEEHAKTRFALAGAHRAIACSACHGPLAEGARPGAVRFRWKSWSCGDCHADPHAGQFAASGGAACERCHGDAAWKPAKIDHAKTRFPLDGAHARAACGSCHSKEKIQGKLTVRYRPMETRCRACHATEPGPRKERST